MDKPMQIGCAHSLGLSNMKVTVSPSSAAFMVTMSSLPAHLRILARLPRLMPDAAAAADQEKNRHTRPEWHHDPAVANQRE